jgi:mRNA interferase HicA
LFIVELREEHGVQAVACRLGATFEPAKGSHFRVRLNGKTSILPMHGKELKKGTLEGIKKQLGLK